MKFNIGDKVRVIGCKDVREISTISTRFYGDEIYQLQNCTSAFISSQLEKVEEPVTEFEEGEEVEVFISERIGWQKYIYLFKGKDGRIWLMSDSKEDCDCATAYELGEVRKPQKKITLTMQEIAEWKGVDVEQIEIKVWDSKESNILG